METQHSVPIWNPVFATFLSANTIGEFSESTKVSTSNTAKQVHPLITTNCYNLPTSSERFIAVCTGNIHIAYTPLSFGLSHYKAILLITQLVT
jgi:hypothetical protein